MKIFSTTLLFICTTIYSFSQEEENCNCPGQHKKGKGTAYISWGYNKDWFSRSNIHFENKSSSNYSKNGSTDYYDFTFYDLKAKDRPGFKDIFRTDLSIPQYVYRLGYYFNDKKDLGIEINFDHVKYVMIDYQTARLKGNIRGTEYDKDTVITPDFLRFEHSDGANFLMLSLLKRKNILKSGNNKHWLSAVFKGGAGIVVPRTDVILFGDHLNNRFHVAGYVTGIDLELRYDFLKHFFLEFSGKGTFANYLNVLTIGNGKANHHFFTFEMILSGGFQFPL